MPQVSTASERNALPCSAAALLQPELDLLPQVQHIPVKPWIDLDAAVGKAMDLLQAQDFRPSNVATMTRPLSAPRSTAI